VKTWCIPPKANADFVYHMEDVLRVYQMPYDQRYPVVCMDEASKQLIGEVKPPGCAVVVKCEDYNRAQGVQPVYVLRTAARLAACPGHGAPHQAGLGGVHP
jgi:hypothetical protein